MSKIKIGFSALLTIILLTMFAAIASAEAPFKPTSTNPAPGIHVGDVDNKGNPNTHKTHGDFQNNTNSCANCHSTHQADADTMLKFKDSEVDMCLACHDGTLNFYNVKGKGAGAGTFNDTHESASMHNVKSGISLSAAPGAYSNTSKDELVCSSCHNPHGSVNDRLLREDVIGGVLYAGQPKGTKTINLALTEDPAYDAINKSSTMSGLKITTSIGPKGATDKVNYAKFCSTCHDDYFNSSGTPNKSGHFGHTTNSSSAGRNCASCHYAHGTDVTLMKDAAGRTTADYMKPVDQGGKGWTKEQAEGYMKDVSAGGSSNKKYTNMAVCWTCHTSSHPLDTTMPEQLGDPNNGTGELWNYVWSSRYQRNLPTFNEKANIR